MDVCVERTHDGVCTVTAPNLVVFGLSEEAAEALLMALQRLSDIKIDGGSVNTKRRRTKRVAASS